MGKKLVIHERQGKKRAFKLKWDYFDFIRIKESEKNKPTIKSVNLPWKFFLAITK